MEVGNCNMIRYSLSASIIINKLLTELQNRLSGILRRPIEDKSYRLVASFKRREASREKFSRTIVVAHP